MGYAAIRHGESVKIDCAKDLLIEIDGGLSIADDEAYGDRAVI
jgi:hypothetical protein